MVILDCSSLIVWVCLSTSATRKVSLWFSSSFSLRAWFSLYVSCASKASLSSRSMIFLLSSSFYLSSFWMFLLASLDSCTYWVRLRISFSSCFILSCKFLVLWPEFSSSAILCFRDIIARYFSPISRSRVCKSFWHWARSFWSSWAAWSSWSLSSASCLALFSHSPSSLTFSLSFSLSLSIYCPIMARLFSYSTTLLLVLLVSLSLFWRSWFSLTSCWMLS